MYAMTQLWSVWISNEIMFCACHEIVLRKVSS